MEPRRVYDLLFHPLVIAVTFGVVAVAMAVDAALAQASQAPEAQALPREVVNNQQTILLTTILGFVSTIIALVFQMWRESRNRRWDLEDRRMAREEADRRLQSQTVELKQEIVSKVDEASVSLDQRLEQIAQVIGHVRPQNRRVTDVPTLPDKARAHDQRHDDSR